MNTRLLHRPLLAAGLLLLSVCASAAVTADKVDPALQAVIKSPARTAAFVARDSARHPAEELSFFGLSADQTVVELWPGGGYWTEILAPYLAGKGHYTAAVSAPGDEDKTTAEWRALVAKQGSRMGKVNTTVLGKGHFDVAPAGSADLVLTFRNLHNWMDAGDADEALAASFRALKPGGVLGIEEHRGRNDRPQDPKAKDGYVRQDYTIALAKKAGFVLAGSSELDANPKDTKDWVDGVWTLPPTLSQGEKDRARYTAIGEADNFVLKFTKPRK